MRTGERPAAGTPAGLTVTLRNYQLQSLSFMLEIEALAGKGGYRNLFWLQHTNSQGKTYFYSPVSMKGGLGSLRWLLLCTPLVLAASRNLRALRPCRLPFG
jgi:hypothetical protein